MSGSGVNANIVVYVFIGIGILIGLATACMLIFLLFNALRNILSPRQRVAAVVARKTHRQDSGGWLTDISDGIDPEPLDRVFGNEENLLDQRVDCYVTFVFNGYSKEFNVPQHIWVNLSEGDEGLLIYQGDAFRKWIAGVKDRAW